MSCCNEQLAKRLTWPDIELACRPVPCVPVETAPPILQALEQIKRTQRILALLPDFVCRALVNQTQTVLRHELVDLAQTRTGLVITQSARKSSPSTKVAAHTWTVTVMRSRSGGESWLIKSKLISVPSVTAPSLKLPNNKASHKASARHARMASAGDANFAAALRHVLHDSDELFNRRRLRNLLRSAVRFACPARPSVACFVSERAVEIVASEPQRNEKNEGDGHVGAPAA